MGSSRLPGKSLRPLGDQLLIGHVLNRAKAIGVAEVVLATSVALMDEPLAAEADRMGYHVFCGSEWDVLGRMARAAELFEADTVIRLTGDCPLLAPEVANAVLALHFKSTVVPALTTNDTTASGYPDGTDVEIMSRRWLVRAAERATERRDREHVTPWLKREGGFETLRCELGDYSRLKLSVDYPEDLERVRTIFRKLPDGDLSLPGTIAACYEAGLILGGQ